MSATWSTRTMISAPSKAPGTPAAIFRSRRWWGAAGLCLLLLGTGTASADEISWRTDYNAARREAVEKNKPLLLDFSTEHCFWCAKLDTTTFRDPVLVALINEHFIPLKVEAQKNPLLTDALRIQSFPTQVLAAPDGKILGTLEGYMDATRFHGHLQRALATVSNPEWMTRDFQEAGKAVAASDYARAVALLKSVLEDGQDRPIQSKARQVLQGLEQQAANLLERAKQLEDKGQSSEAMDVLTELLRAFPGTQAAADGGQRMSALALKPDIKNQQRTRRAGELLAQAREDYRTQQYLCCMDRCEILASTYADLPQGSEAIQLLTEIKNNPEWMRRACDNLTERLGTLYLSLAETWLKKGDPNQAVFCLERVIQAFPSSRQAEAAQVRLAQIQGQPTRQTNFKKPSDAERH